jgi:DNA-binding NtrC family response regulator
VRRVGSNRTRSVNVRVIAATNRDVESEVRSGRFRQDLLYRLDVIGLRLPPLRERREDIPALVEHFAARLRAPGRPELVFSDEAVRALENYDWPGNVRELENAVSRAAAFCDTAVRVEDLPERVRNFAVTDLGEAGAPDPLTAAADAPPGARVDDAAAWPSLDELELRYAERALAHTRGNKHAAARLLKIDRKTLSRILSRGRAGEGTAAEDRAAGPN